MPEFHLNSNQDLAGIIEALQLSYFPFQLLYEVLSFELSYKNFIKMFRLNIMNKLKIIE